MKKLFLGIIGFIIPLLVHAQTYPSPVFGGLSVGVNGSTGSPTAPIASAVNYLSMYGAVIGGSPSIVAAGSDSSVGLQIGTKGTGKSVLFNDGGNGTAFGVNNAGAGAIAARLGVTANSTGVAPTLYAAGSDTNINISLVPKGTGVVTTAAGLTVGAASTFTSLSHSQQEIDKSYTFNTPTTGTTVTLAANVQTAIIAPAGTLAALTVTLPACTAGYDGSVARFSTSQILTALTVNATSGTVSNAPTTATAGQSFGFICRGSTTTWYVR